LLRSEQLRCRVTSTPGLFILQACAWRLAAMRGSWVAVVFGLAWPRVIFAAPDFSGFGQCKHHARELQILLFNSPIFNMPLEL